MSQVMNLHGGLLQASNLLELIESTGAPIHQRTVEQSEEQNIRVGNKEYSINSFVTFTPYASSQPCSARCWFCSENLIPKDSEKSALSLRPQGNYQQLLKQALLAVRDIPLGLSLSGLEITDNVDWLISTLGTLKSARKFGIQWQDKAAYTNGAGFAKNDVRDILIQELDSISIDRIELSRHHFSDEANQQIMRFRKTESIQSQPVFEEVFSDLNDSLPVSLVCILQKPGIKSSEEIEEYINWALKYGCKKIIFRELSQVPLSYKNNLTYRCILSNRVSINSLVVDWLSKADAEIDYFINGYYYWNAHFLYKGIEIVFERSDYELMNLCHDSNTINKLVFFANGNLCSGWKPEKNIIYKALSS